MNEEERLAKNKQISQTKRLTVERHADMLCKTFDVKIQYNKLSSLQKEKLERIFLEQKWYKNYILNWLNQSEENKLNKFDIKQTIITKKDAEMNDIEVKINYLSASSRQCLVQRMLSNIKTLHSLKAKGIQKPGKLKFSKEETIIDLKQYGNSHTIVSSKKVKIVGFGKLPVNGLNQFINISQIEFTNARLIHKPTGYYIQFVVFIPKQNKEKINQTIGIDFGCETSFTLSNGEKISAKVPESERLKKLQRKLSRKNKGSKNWQKNVLLIKKEYQSLTNKKNDLSNKIVAKFLEYETIVIQDEQLTNWQKSNHGKAIQQSVLGRVKAKLKLSPNVVILNKFVPTTKLCTNCGTWHDELKLWNRTFKCDCGICLDRDIHAAQNMIWFYNHNVGVEHTKLTRVEMEALIIDALAINNQLPSMKHEAATL